LKSVNENCGAQVLTKKIQSAVALQSLKDRKEEKHLIAFGKRKTTKRFAAVKN